MKKEIIGKILVVFAMVGLTFIFAALSVHYDMFAFSYRETPVEWTEMLLGFGIIAFVSAIAIGLGCLFVPQMAMILLMPFEVWDNISAKHGKWQHLINVFLLALCVAFVAYAVNLVTILEHLSGEHYKLMPTFGGFLAMAYAWIIFFGTLILYGWLSGLIDAFIAFFKRCAETEQAYNAEQQKKAERQKKRRELKKKKRIVYTKL